MFCRRKKAPIQIKTNQSSWPSCNYSRNVIQKCVSNEVSNLFIVSLTAVFCVFLCHDKQKLPLWFGRWCGVECVYAKMMFSQIRLLTDGLFSLLRAQRCQLLLVWRSFIWDKEVRLLVIQPFSYRNICKSSTGDISCSWGKGVSKLNSIISLSSALCFTLRRAEEMKEGTSCDWRLLNCAEI